jgi:broad specificity phosphatase PhoE
MILMRHGQSQFNAKFAIDRVDPGLRDPGLTDLGRDQARAAAAHLRTHDVKAIVASPYTRTLETAEIVAEALDMPFGVEPLVGEQACFTCDIGSPRTALCERWPHLELDHLPDEWWPPLEEPEHALDARCRAFRARMTEAGDWRGVLVVTHYHVIRTLTGHIVANAALVRFDPSADHPGGGTVVPVPDPC